MGKLALLFIGSLMAQETWRMVGMVETEPTDLHRAVFVQTSLCAEIPPTPPAPGWFRADSITAVSDGARVAGIVNMGDNAIVLDRIAWLDPYVISVVTLAWLLADDDIPAVLAHCVISMDGAL